MNPAVTASCIVNGGFPAAQGAAYMLAQVRLHPLQHQKMCSNISPVTTGFLLHPDIFVVMHQCTGAGLAGGLNYAMFKRGISSMEKSLGVTRGPASASVVHTIPN